MQEKMLSVLLRECSPAAVYLLGQVSTQARVCSVFCGDGPGPVLPTHFFYLVVMAGLPENQYNALQDKLENNLRHLVPSTVLLLDRERFTGWLRQGHPFAVQVYRSAGLLYGAVAVPPEEVSLADETERQQQKQKLCRQALARVSAFLAGADLYLLRQDYRLAAFMLHQAAEQALHALLQLRTGLRVNTHSLDKLLRYSSLFCVEAAALFPQATEKEKRLFSLLNKAYIDSRYKEDYVAGYADLAVLREKLSAVEGLLKKWGD